jgi:predicted nucleotidyltransferase
MDEKIKKEIEKAVAILKQFGATEVYLFGSWATGKAHPDSDLDLAVSGIQPERWYRVWAKVMFALNPDVHLVDLGFPDDFTEYLRANEKLKSVR